MKTKEFLKTLSEAEINEAEQIECEVQEACKQGWSEETMITFIRSAMALRKNTPVLIPNLLDLALRQGVVAIVATFYGAKSKKRALRKSKLSGV
jgi:hypothetical protein